MANRTSKSEEEVFKNEDTKSSSLSSEKSKRSQEIVVVGASIH